MKTPYGVLGVRRSADAKAIRAALRRAAKAYHPDVNSGDPEAEQHLKEALDAYALLMNPDRRAAYDRHLRDRLQRRARRFLMTAIASASVFSAAALALAFWLVRPHEAQVVTRDPRVAAVEAVHGVNGNENVAPFTHDTPEKGVPKEVADREFGRDPSVAASSLAREWRQMAERGDPKTIWEFVLRNPLAPEAELARSWLTLLTDATEDVPFLTALREAGGTLTERADQRLSQLSAVAAIREKATAAIAVNDAEPNQTAVPLDSATYLKRGMLRFGKMDFDGAIADFDSAIGLEPGNALAHRIRAIAWGSKGDRDRALADFETAIRIDPANPGTFRDRGTFWRSSGELDLALVDLDQAVRLGFSDARAYNERGLVWYQKGRYDRAIADFTQAIKVDPKFGEGYLNRSVALRDKGDLAGSASDLEEANRIGATALLGDDPSRSGK